MFTAVPAPVIDRLPCHYFLSSGYNGINGNGDPYTLLPDGSLDEPE
ncbi:MAG: hypothetical protein V6Z81_06605 [Parvularculales bacterium]